MRNRALLAVAIALLGIAVMSAACTATEPASPTMAVAPEEEVTNPVSEVGPVPEGLPEFAYRSAQAVRGYQIAVAEKELFTRLPCYCGCGQDAESYENLADCFFEPEGDFNSHAANCQICLEQAEDAARWKREGLSTSEIRDRTDQEYEGRGKPTDTPPVG